MSGLSTLKKSLLILSGVFLLVILITVLWTASPLAMADEGDYTRLDPAKAQSIDWPAITDEATVYLQDLLRMRTIRGDEHQASLYIQKILEKEGIAVRIYQHPEDPRRSNLVAEIIPDDIAPEYKDEGIILTGHSDVVEVNPERWKQPPFSGALVDGKIWGRGAIDMKGHIVMGLMSMLLVKRLDVPLKRKLMLLVLADEESDGKYGVKFMVEKHRDVFDGYKYVFNEGGLGTEGVAVPGSKIFNIQWAEKGKIWAELSVDGESSHGARPPEQYALLNMIQFLNAVHEMETDLTIVPEMETFLYQMGEAYSFPNSFFMKRNNNPLIRPLILPALKANRYLVAMTTNTRAFTGLNTNEDEGINVVADKAFAKIDIRLLPNTTPEQYLDKLEALAEPYGVKIKPTGTIVPNSSPMDSEFFKVMSRVSVDNVPGSVVTPLITPGNTDNTYLREIGLQCYGLTPVLLNSEELGSTHSDNEYLSQENLKLGTKIMFETVVGMN
ncbi:MAG: peptidase [Spirochaetaceae bacterium]|nr:peptidase [Spirochaetaceae bacterium]|tara:strand:- start:50797 stop:52290 length:1494 start_codon:yes stop_codon:yes gene_type:complete